MRASLRATFVLLAVIAVFLAGWVVRARRETSASSCMQILYAIDGAKVVWELETKPVAHSVPSWSDLVKSGAISQILHCPAGGEYVIGAVGELPRCSMGGPSHSLPARPLQ